jgi:hypothetical protein
MAQLEISESAERNKALELENRKIKETLAQWEKAVKIMIGTNYTHAQTYR